MTVNGLDTRVEPADGDGTSPVTLGSGVGMPDGHGDRDSLTARPDTDEVGQGGRCTHVLASVSLVRFARLRCLGGLPLHECLPGAVPAEHFPLESVARR